MVEFIEVKDDEPNENKERKKKFKWFSIKGVLIIFLLFIVISTVLGSITFSLTPKVAVVPIKGIISTDDSVSIYGSTLSSRFIADTLYSLRDDNSVKAVILDINSPGGSPVATEEISIAIEELKKEKEVYAIVSEVGASGAFWIALSADKVYASSMSTLGSIGVTSAGLGFENFIKDYNISYRRQTAGEFKDMGSPFREVSEKEVEMIDEILNQIHSQFISHIAKSRNMTFDEVSEYSNGEIFLGSKALEIGFIDEIGHIPKVKSDLEEIHGPLMLVDYGPVPTLLESLGIKGKIPNFIGNSNIMLIK
jgi:protease-4